MQIDVNVFATDAIAAAVDAAGSDSAAACAEAEQFMMSRGPDSSGYIMQDCPGRGN